MLGNPRYPTYTIFLALVIACIVVLALTPFFIRFMRRGGIGQQVRVDGPEGHLVKQGTPTMGGVIIIAGIVISVVLVGNLSAKLVLCLAAVLCTTVLGLLDDIESVAHKRSLGLTPPQKMGGLVLISVGFTIFAVNICGIEACVSLPGSITIDLSIGAFSFDALGISWSIPWLYIIFCFLLFAGLSNAVNLTDGLDGLAGGTTLVVMLFMAMVAYRRDDLQLAIFAGACAGACTGFLWFNCYPASIFMGDTGSLALGSAFASLAILTKTEVVSLVMGGIFVCEALSVIIQVVSRKFFGRRVFLMAPFHHHFEKLGWSETKVVIRFWIIAAAFATLGFVLFFHLG